MPRLVHRAIAAGEILNRTAGQAGGRRTRDRVGDGRGIVAVPVLEIAAHRTVRRRRDRGDMREHLVAANGVIAPPG